METIELQKLWYDRPVRTQHRDRRINPIAALLAGSSRSFNTRTATRVEIEASPNPLRRVTVRELQTFALVAQGKPYWRHRREFEREL